MKRRTFLLGMAAAMTGLPALGQVIRPLSPYYAENLGNLSNPFYLSANPGCTQCTGWLDAWTTRVSPECIAAKSVADVVRAVQAARQGARLSIKGTGHDYLGRSNGGDLLLWTHPMRRVWLHDYQGIPAVSAEAGARWLEVYGACQKAGRYAQGGGCTTVGVAGGHIQGSGFGSFSKRYGTGAAGVLEYEVVTADGAVRICNEEQHEDLFWALRGGGGGTFGVVTRVTLRTHPLPERAGLVTGRVYPRSGGDFGELLRRFVQLYPRLNNEHWGEQIAIAPDNALELGLTFLNLTAEQARAVWQPLLNEEVVTVDFSVREMDPAHLWDPEWFQERDPGFVTPNPGHSGQYWWSSNQEEVSSYICSYQSRWLPFRMFSEEGLADLLYRASRLARVHLHLNKGLSGAHPDALERTRKTCLHPAAFDAAALIIVAANLPQAFPNIPGHEPDLAVARQKAERVNGAMALLRAGIPNSGAYSNEADYFEPDWQQAFWGPHYERLLAIKRKYDPTNLFRVHHGVGSEL